MERPLTWQSAEIARSIQENHKAHRRYFIAKRILDIVVSATLLVVLSPLLLLIALLVVLDSPGAPIFRQERVNLRRRQVDGRVTWQIGTFSFLKFRTMYKDADSNMHRAFVQAFIARDEEAMKALQEGRVQTNGSGHTADTSGRASKPGKPGMAGVRKLVNDPRVTRLGAFLRKTSLDELPQLWNVLKGDISLVGPRPPIPYEVEVYEPWHQKRLTTIPGVTGLWQITARSSVDFDEMVKLDLDYIEHQSFGLDLKILLETPLAVIRTRGAV